MTRTEENKVNKLAKLIGSKRRLAEVIQRDPVVVSRMSGRGIVRPEFNKFIKAFAAENSDIMGEDWALEVLGCLEDEACPVCGNKIDA